MITSFVPFPSLKHKGFKTLSELEDLYQGLNDYIGCIKDQ